MNSLKISAVAIALGFACAMPAAAQTSKSESGAAKQSQSASSGKSSSDQSASSGASSGQSASSGGQTTSMGQDSARDGDRDYGWIGLLGLLGLAGLMRRRHEDHRVDTTTRRSGV